MTKRQYDTSIRALLLFIVLQVIVPQQYKPFHVEYSCHVGQAMADDLKNTVRYKSVRVRFCKWETEVWSGVSPLKSGVHWEPYVYLDWCF